MRCGSSGQEDSDGPWSVENVRVAVKQEVRYVTQCLDDKKTKTKKKKDNKEKDKKKTKTKRKRKKKTKKTKITCKSSKPRCG